MKYKQKKILKKIFMVFLANLYYLYKFKLKYFFINIVFFFVFSNKCRQTKMMILSIPNKKIRIVIIIRWNKLRIKL